MTKKTKIILVIAAVAVIAGIITTLVIVLGSRDDAVAVQADRPSRAEQPPDENPDVYYSGEPTSIDFHYEFREEVKVINNAPLYSIVEADDTFIITIHNPNNEIKRLLVGDTFAFEPTAQNLSGIAGHITKISNEGAALVITARIPQSLDEIFDEFDLAADINILADAAGIYPAEEIAGIDGIEIIRNPTRFVGVTFLDVKLSENVTISGGFKVYEPRMNLSLDSISKDEVSVVMQTEANLSVKATVDMDKYYPIITVHCYSYGINAHLGVGIRINVEGEVSIEYRYSAEAEFGVRNNEAFFEYNTDETLNFNISAKAELSANVRAGLHIFFIPIKGVQADFGKGAQTSSELQRSMCAEDCVVIGLYNVARISPMKNWGIFGYLDYNIDLTSGEITSHRFLYESRWADTCHHGGAVILDPERFTPDEWEYFILPVNLLGDGPIYRRRLDGTEQTEVIAGRYSRLVDYGDWILFTNHHNAILSMHKEIGIETTLSSGGGNNGFDVADGWVYYATGMRPQNDALYKVRVDGTENTLLSEENFYENIKIAGDWIYFRNGSWLNENWTRRGDGFMYKIRTNGTEVTQVNTIKIGDFDINDEWIFYACMENNKNLYRMNIDSTGETLISDYGSVSNIRIDGDWVYYYERPGEGQFEVNIKYKIRTDGTERQRNPA
jgi:hypothetical protein